MSKPVERRDWENDDPQPEDFNTPVRRPWEEERQAFADQRAAERAERRAAKAAAQG